MTKPETPTDQYLHAYRHVRVVLDGATEAVAAKLKIDEKTAIERYSGLIGQFVGAVIMAERLAAIENEIWKSRPDPITGF